MNLLVTHPGKFGDILWALPTLRALAEATGAPVSLLTSSRYAALLPLLAQQEYIGETLEDTNWPVVDTAPMTPRVPPSAKTIDNVYPRFDRVVHLGYQEWPEVALPLEAYRQAQREWQQSTVIPPLDLETPWITPVPGFHAKDVAVGFTDEYFELKYGLWSLQAMLDWRRSSLCGVLNSRWQKEGNHNSGGWLLAAEVITAAKIFFGDCSALHVLACALGKQCVLMEPNPHRHADIFYPYGKTGRVRLVLGTDGKPTFDARHCADAIREVLNG